MIDHIGGKHLSIRVSTDGGIVIRDLDGSSAELHLTSDAWFEFLGLVTAIKASVDFAAEYHA